MSEGSCSPSVCWSLHPQLELLVLESRDLLREPLNEAVNEEVSSLNLSGRSSSPQGLLFWNPSSAPRMDTGSSWPPLQLFAGRVAASGASAQQGLAVSSTPGYRNKHRQPPGSKSLPAGTFFVLGFGAECPLARPRGSGAPPHRCCWARGGLAVSGTQRGPSGCWTVVSE